MSVLVLAIAAQAQVLDLEETPEPPALDRFTYANDLIGQLEQEIAANLASERSADPINKLTLQAIVNVRVVAAELLGEGDKADAKGSASYLAGLTLAQNRAALDATMLELVDLAKRIAAAPRVRDEDQDRLHKAIDSLRLFNEKAVANAQDLRTTDTLVLDGALAAMFTPLADAVSAIDRKEVVNHWMTRSAITPTPAMLLQKQSGASSAGRAPARSLEQMKSELGTLALRDDTKAELDSIVDFLERGSAFPDLRPQVDASLHHISQVIDLFISLKNADWLTNEAHDKYLDRLQLGVVLYKDPRTRERGQRHLDRLEASRVIIDRVTALAGANVRVNAVRDAFLDADAMVENPAQAELGQEQLRELGAVLGRMLAYRELGDVDLKHDLQGVVRQLERNYQDAEKRLLNEIDTLATKPGALTDPGFASLMQDQEQYLSDISRVRHMPEWVDRIRLIDPDSAGPFHNQTRKMVSWLLDPNRRPDVLRAMDQIEQQLGLFYPLPFETELRNGDAIAVTATGGLHEKLIRKIDATRRAWARAWANGDAGSEQAKQLLLLYRLCQTMADTAHMLNMQATPDVLNRWSAWEMNKSAGARTVSDLPGRLKLASAAAVNGDDNALAKQLDEIDRDAPVAKLIGRLAQVIGPAMANLPDGAAGCMGQLTTAPRRDAWWLNKRKDLAALCRYQTEAEFARTTKHDQLLDQLTVYVNAVAENLLAQLGERCSTIPTLIGFDGSDPNPKVDMPKK